jgi:putative membrane protein
MKYFKPVFILLVIVLAGWIGRAQDQEKDISFVRDAAIGGLFEVQIGKLAMSKATMQEVKSFGQKMVNDHSMANEKLKQLALTKNITLPDSLDAIKKAKYDSIALLKGRAFDEAYVKQMVKAHNEDVKKFEAASKYLVDSDLRGWAAQTLPTLKMHLQHVVDLNATVNEGRGAGKGSGTHAGHSDQKDKK